MNQNEFNNSSSAQPETYHATTNLNIDIENPQINMNSVVGVNIKNVDNTPKPNDRFSNTDIGSYANFDVNQGSSVEHINNSILQNEMQHFNSSVVQENTTVSENKNSESLTNQFVPTSSDSTSFTQDSYIESSLNQTEKIIYEPTMEEKKEKNVNFSASKELKLIIFIALVLFIFIMIMPNIYDFFKNLQLVLTG